MNENSQPNFDDLDSEKEIEIKIDDNLDSFADLEDNSQNETNGKKMKIKKHPSKKKKWLIITSVIVIIGLLVAGYYIFFKDKTDVKKTANVTVSKAISPTFESRLTGLPVTEAQSVLPVTAVMIENSIDARPQSGLSQAGIVYEALAEGGITRFMAVYEEGEPSSIGPIRSARPYYIDWMLPYDASYVHVGGSPLALNQIQTDNVKDINQFYYGSTFTRLASRQAPHNVYTSMSNLLALEKTKGWTTSNFVGFARKADTPSKDPTATSINLNISNNSDMNVHYQYNASNNSYERSEGGSPMIDADTGKQLEPKVVVAMIVPWSEGALDSSNAYYSVYQDVGSGQAYIFQDGTVTLGTWSKASPTAQLLLGDENGSPKALNAGQTWITALGSSSMVNYTN